MHIHVVKYLAVQSKKIQMKNNLLHLLVFSSAMTLVLASSRPASSSVAPDEISPAPQNSSKQNKHKQHNIFTVNKICLIYSEKPRTTGNEIRITKRGATGTVSYYLQ